MKLYKTDIDQLDKISKLKLVNSVTGAKPANLVGTVDASGNENLAIISSVVHLGTSPPLLGLFMRPNPKNNRDTFDNISERGVYTINAVRLSDVEKAHFTSYNYPKDESEFKHCKLLAEYIDDFQAPFVKESPIKIGLKHVENIVIKANNSVLIVGEITLVETPKLDINLEDLEISAISGLNSYYGLYKISEFPYPTKENLPEW